jgi:nitroreductase
MAVNVHCARLVYPMSDALILATAPVNEMLAEYLSRRRSVTSRQLRAPGPDSDALNRIMTIAARVPDHGKLAPWRFVVIVDDARHRLGDTLAELRAAREPETPAERIAKDREQFAHAPVVVMVVSTTVPHAKIPEWEQVLSAGAVCLNMLHGAEAHGFAAQWLTGWCCYDAAARAALGLEEAERIAGFIHIGTPVQRPVDRDRPDVAALTTILSR